MEINGKHNDHIEWSIRQEMLLQFIVCWMKEEAWGRGMLKDEYCEVISKIAVLMEC